MKKILLALLAGLVVAAGCKHRVGGGKRLGCYKDQGDATPGTSGRDLDGALFTSDSLTVEACTSYCKGRGFAYAAVQYRTACFCGSSYGKFGAVPDSECSMKCPGNTKETCGGSWRNEVYELAR
jgi:hypothetical protein